MKTMMICITKVACVLGILLAVFETILVIAIKQKERELGDIY